MPLCPCCSVGRELIRGNWEAAVQLIMAGHEGEREDSAAARRLFLEAGDVAGALKQMPRHQTVERAILEVCLPAPIPLHEHPWSRSTAAFDLRASGKCPCLAVRRCLWLPASRPMHACAYWGLLPASRGVCYAPCACRELTMQDNSPSGPESAA